MTSGVGLVWRICPFRILVVTYHARASGVGTYISRDAGQLPTLGRTRERIFGHPGRTRIGSINTDSCLKQGKPLRNFLNETPHVFLQLDRTLGVDRYFVILLPTVLIHQLEIIDEVFRDRITIVDDILVT
jgi:hypothetical protein